jgi:hypothetical protein
MEGATAMVKLELLLATELTPYSVLTAIAAVPAVARFAAGILTEQERVELLQEPTSGVLQPFHVTTDPFVIPVPVTTSVTGLGLPAGAVDGLRFVMLGAPAKVNVEPKELTPSALHTVIRGVPTDCRLGTVASREDELPYQDGSVVLPNFTMDPVVNPDPAMVTETVLGLFAVAPLGLRDVMLGGATVANA